MHRTYNPINNVAFISNMKNIDVLPSFIDHKYIAMKLNNSIISRIYHLYINDDNIEVLPSFIDYKFIIKRYRIFSLISSFLIKILLIMKTQNI